MSNTAEQFPPGAPAGTRIKMKDRQIPLCQHYKEQPQDATIIDSAGTSSRSVPASSPLYSEVAFCDSQAISLPVGVHRAVGGESDYPTPGDILCGAIAACLDSTIRIVSNRVGVRLKKLDVNVRGRVDVRGTLRVDDAVPVAFQAFEIDVTIKPAGFVPGMMVDKLLRAAERSCIVIQTLRGGAEITVTRRR